MRRNPAYRYHKARNCAVVTIAGKDHYLGTHDSPESWEEYHRLLAEHLNRLRLPHQPETKSAVAMTVTELAATYWNHVTSYYVKNGRPTSEQAAIKLALKFMRRLYGSMPVSEFTPNKLKAIREALIVHPITRTIRRIDPTTRTKTTETKILRHGLTRKTINETVNRIKRMFAWAVQEELVPVEIHSALQRVPGLRRGKTEARETTRIKPVADDHIQAVLPFLPQMVQDMVQIHRLCGGRPQDIVGLRGDLIDRSGVVWEYQPVQHKTEHHNDRDDPELDRTVYFGPLAQAILKPYLQQDSQGYVFSPLKSEGNRNAVRRARRHSPMTPSQSRRLPRGRKRAGFKDHYDVASYRRAVRRACTKAGIPMWHPNQLRHGRLTEIRKLYGLEASRVCGGHREIGVTQHYAEQDRDLARRVMSEIG